MLSKEELHQKILYPCVRIRTEKAGGSGTVIYSEPDPKKSGEYISIIMSCEHVVDDSIHTREDFDSLLKRKILKEFTEQVTIETFDYVYLSTVNSANSHKAEIIAYDKYYDIAILKLLSPKKCDYIAKIISKEDIKNLRLFTECYAAGCSLGHFPLVNKGEITFLLEDIENRPYLMANCNSIFGNSGGALFLGETGEQIGITARISAIQLGFGIDIITFMGFSVHPTSIYKFFEEQELRFLYDRTDNYYDAMARREKKQKEALLSIFKEKSEGVSS